MNLKKFKICLMALTLILLAVQSGICADQSKTLTFEWNHEVESYEATTKYELGVADQAGGPYETKIEIPKQNPVAKNTYQGSSPVIFSGAPGSDIVKFFVMRACDADECSDWSNEVSHSEHIKLAPPQELKKVSAEVSLKVIPTKKKTKSVSGNEKQSADEDIAYMLHMKRMAKK